MSLITEQTVLPGVVVLKPVRYGDTRGYLSELYHQGKYSHAGITCTFVQDNVSCSSRGVLRGLHYQIRYPQAKLIQVLSGEIYDVAVDIRCGSPTFSKWLGVHLSDANGIQLFIPEGFAHGFYVLSEKAIVTYKCSDFYHPDDEGGLHWSDPQVGIPWPSDNPTVSEKDAKNPTLMTIPQSKLPVFP